MQSWKINFTKALLALVTIFSSITAKAQDAMQSNDIEMADTMRANGKIYVVVVCVLVIFTGIITYMVMMTRKVNKLEKLIDQK